MFAYMTNIARNIKGYQISLISTAAVFSYATVALTYTKEMPTFGLHQWWKKRQSQNEARSFIIDNTSVIKQQDNSINSNHITPSTSVHETDYTYPKLNYSTLKEKEIRIILLGATGSGKSSAGNILLKNGTVEKDKFETSYYSNSKTTKSLLKNREGNFEGYTVSVIDTPATSDTGLSKQETVSQIQKAIALSSPGPHAFLLCIPATAITSYYTDVLKQYKKYFGNTFNDFVIVAFTRYDQFEKENNKSKEKEKHNSKCEIAHAIEQDSVLHEITKNGNDQIFLCNEKTENQTDQLHKVIGIINEIKKRKTTLKEHVYASCELSEHAEQLLVNDIQKKKESDPKVTRHTVKTSDHHLSHFSKLICSYCNKFKDNV